MGRFILTLFVITAQSSNACVSPPNILTLDGSQFSDSLEINLYNSCTGGLKISEKGHTRQLSIENKGGRRQLCISGNKVLDTQSTAAVDRTKAQLLLAQLEAKANTACRGKPSMECLNLAGPEMAKGVDEFDPRLCLGGKCNLERTKRDCESARFSTSTDCRGYVDYTKNLLNSFRNLSENLGRVDRSNAGQLIDPSLHEHCQVVFAGDDAVEFCNTMTNGRLRRAIDNNSNLLNQPDCEVSRYSCFDLLPIFSAHGNKANEVAKIRECGQSIDRCSEGLAQIEQVIGGLRQSADVGANSTYQHCGDIPALDRATGARPLEIYNNNKEVVGRVVSHQDGTGFDIVSNDASKPGLSFSYRYASTRDGREAMTRTISAKASRNGATIGRLVSTIDPLCYRGGGDGRTANGPNKVDLNGRDITTVPDSGCGGSIQTQNQPFRSQPSPLRLNGQPVDQQGISL